MIGFDITSGKLQRALLLHYGGEELKDNFDTLDNTGSAHEEYVFSIKQDSYQRETSDKNSYKRYCW